MELLAERLQEAGGVSQAQVAVYDVLFHLSVVDLVRHWDQGRGQKLTNGGDVSLRAFAASRKTSREFLKLTVIQKNAA